MQMNGWKVIYKGIIYRPINIMPALSERVDVNDATNLYEPSVIEMWVVDDRGRLVMVRDRANMFQFVKDLGND